MIMIVCILALMVCFDVRFSSIKNPWILFLLFTTVFLRWKEEGGIGVLDGCLQFLVILMILLPIFSSRILGAADVKIFLALSVYLSFKETIFLIICSLFLGGLIGLLLLLIPTKYKSSIFFSVISVQKPTNQAVSMQGRFFIPGLTFHYIHFTIPIFISFMITSYGGVYELLLCYL